VIERLSEEGVLTTPFGPSTIRATTHRDVSMADIDTALSVMQRLYS